MNTNFRDILEVFNRHRVRYLVVGGYAVMQYTEPRFTKDLDLWIDATPHNADRVYAALAEFGAPISGCDPKEFTEPEQVFQLGVEPERVDVMTSIPGVKFGPAWDKRTTKIVGGLRVPFISKADLIRAKKAAGRPVDLIDLDNLKKLT